HTIVSRELEEFRRRPVVECRQLNDCTQSGTGPRGYVLEKNGAIQPLHDAFYNREAKTRPVIDRPGTAKKRLEYALHVELWNARPGILDEQDGFLSAARKADIDASARRRVTKGVIDQVAKHGRQHDGLSAHWNRFDSQETEIDSTRRRPGHEARNNIFRAFI